MRRRTLLTGFASIAGLSTPFVGAAAFAQQVRPGRWLRLEGPNFIVYSAASEDKTREELLALESFHALLSRIMPREVRSVLKLTVYMTGTSKDFELTAPWAKSEVAGFYGASVEEVRAVYLAHKNFERQRDMPKDVRALDARAVLFHEYAHHFIMANNRVSYPAWYNEGIAEFLSTVEFADEGATIGKFTRNRAVWLTVGDWLDIRSFLTKDPGKLSEEDNAQFYAQAWLATHYLFLTPGRAKGFDTYVAALHKGGDPLSAFEPAFGMSIEAFDKELRAYKKKPITFLKIPGVAIDKSLQVSVSRLPAAADDLLMPISYLRNGPDPKGAEKSIAAVRVQSKKHEGDPFAIRSKALIETWYGDLGEARNLLDTLVASDAADPEAQHLSGLCDLRMAYAANDPALFKRSRGAFAAAHRIDGTRAGSLFRYIETVLHMQQGHIDDHLLEVAVAAYQLAPQVSEFAVLAAQGLMQHKRFAEAAAMMRPLVANTHSSDRVAAQMLMAAAQAEKLPQPFIFLGSARTVGKPRN